MDTQVNDFIRRVRLRYMFRNKPDSAFKLYPTFRKTVFQPNNASPPIEAYLRYAKGKIMEKLDQTLAISPNQLPTRSRCHMPNWLTPTLKDLRDNKDIIITNADKNMGICIVNTQAYINEGLRQLSDTNTYTLVTEKPDMNSLFNGLRELLTRHMFLYVDTRKKKLSTYAEYMLQLENHPALRIGAFYMLMKVHKTPIAGRPIVSSINTVTYFASKFVDYCLQPFLKRIPSYVESSQHLIYKLHRHDPFPESATILCADIDSLYPNIPLEKGMEYFQQSLLRYNAIEKRFAPREIIFLCELTYWILKNNYFMFGDKMYLQKQGTAMGTPVAVVFACLFIDQLERLIVEQTGIRALLYNRYIDDIFGIFDSPEEAQRFITAFNSHLPTIHCSNVTISQQSGIFLDVEIFRPSPFQGQWSTRLYQKPQNKYLYLPPFSFHSKKMFSAFIREEIRRYRILSSEDQDFKTACDQFRKRLQARGYTPATLEAPFSLIPSRQDLLKRIQARFSPPPIQPNANASPMPVPPPNPLIFKTILTPETLHLSLGKQLKPDPSFLADRDMQQLMQPRPPVICFSNSKSIASLFSKSRRTLHQATSSGQSAPSSSTIS